MSTAYRMEYGYNQVRLTVTKFGRTQEVYDRHSRNTRTRSYWEHTYEPTEASINRFTAIANAAIQKPRHELPVRLLEISDGFGWEMTHYAVYACPTCGKPSYEYEKDHGGLCLDCWVKARIAERAAQDIATAPIAPRPQCQVEADGDIIYA